MEPVEPMIFASRRDRFWFFLVPGTLLFVLAQLRLSWWALRVFYPKTDPLPRLLFGYGPPALALLALTLLPLIYLSYASRRFEIQASGLLVRGPLDTRRLSWDDITVWRGTNSATISGSQERFRIHSFFFPDLPRFCKLLEMARRKRREELSL